MRSSACPRLSDAEAKRDQRLGPAELASFERHLDTCDACAREVENLEALAAPLRDGAPHGVEVDELHARRERTRLLLAFDQMAEAPVRARTRTRAAVRWRAWQFAAAAAAVVLAAAGAGLWHAVANRTPVATIAVHAGGATVWSGRTDGPHPMLVLERGSLFVRVENGGSQAAPLRVLLPDGELEDIGTVFTVRAEDGQTTRVSVREGAVVLRIRGEPARVIRAGETWRRAEPSAQASARAPTPAPQGAPVRHAVERRSAPRADPARDFRAAIALLEAGDNRGAAAAFTRFVARHPSDGRVEDAAYLRVLACHRAGAGAEVEAAARDYLRDHPAGLRRVEVENVRATMRRAQGRNLSE